MHKHPLRQHLDVILLGLFVFCCMIAFVAHEKGWLKQAKAKESFSLNDAFSRLRGDEDPAEAEAQEPAPVQDRHVNPDDDADHPRNLDRVTPPPGKPGVTALGPNSPLGGMPVFPPDNPWNQSVESAPVDALSELILKGIGNDKGLFPDFGAGIWNGAEIGIPYIVVDGSQKPVPISFTAYGDQSDPGPYPVPPSAPVEGAPNLDGDRHVIVIDRESHKLYELFRAFPIANGQMWRAESGAIFDLQSNELRPEGWTSADAAGLPIFPGLVRYEEVVELGAINHALRFTVQRSRRAYVHPARHHASRDNNALLPPMGMRVRLKADYDIAKFPKEAQVILTCLKKYGMILADNGSDLYISGAPDPRWNDTALKTIREVKAGDFEVIRMDGLVAE